MLIRLFVILFTLAILSCGTEQDHPCKKAAELACSGFLLTGYCVDEAKNLCKIKNNGTTILDPNYPCFKQKRKLCESQNFQNFKQCVGNHTLRCLER